MQDNFQLQSATTEAGKEREEEEEEGGESSKRGSLSLKRWVIDLLQVI